MRNKKTEMPANHISHKTRTYSEKQIQFRFDLFKACINQKIEITDEIRKALDTDKALFELSCTFQHNDEDKTIEPITRATVCNHSKLKLMQKRRKTANEVLKAAEIDTNELNSSSSPDSNNSENKKTGKETKASLKEDKLRLQDKLDDMVCELLTLRSAYRQLLGEVQKKLPFDSDVAKILEDHHKSSLIKDRVRLKVIK